MTKPSLLSLFCILSMALPATAANFTVTSDADSGANTLRQAIIDAQSSLGDDTIRFSLPGPFQQIVLESALVVDNLGMGRITINASNIPDKVLLVGDGEEHRIFEIAYGADLVLINLYVSGGQAPHGVDGLDGDPPEPGGNGEHGGGVLNEGTLTLEDCELYFNKAGDGGAGGNYNGMAAEASAPGGNGGSGGAIYSTGNTASVTLVRTTLDGNSSGNGGKGGSEAAGGNGGKGAGIFLEQSAIVATRSEFTSNRCGDGGEGGDPGVTMNGGDGGTGGHGGGLAMELSNATLTNSLFQGNLAGVGGSGGAGDVDNAGGAGGAGGDGGGLWNAFFPDSAEAQVSGCLFTGNYAGMGSNAPNNGTDGGDGGRGGGIYLEAISGGDQTWTMENTTIHQNFAGGGGSAGSGNNGAGGDGGGIFFLNDFGDAVVRLSHNTIIANVAGDSFDQTLLGVGGGVGEEVGLIGVGGYTVANTIISSNSASNNPEIGPFTPEGNNLIGEEPELGDLQDNGGPTRTFAPVYGSPVINGGGAITDPLSRDQRGVARPANGVPDIGAVEVTVQVDNRIGSKANPVRHKIDNFYSPTGAGQQENVKIVGKKKEKFFFSVQNDGTIDTPIILRGTPPTKKLKLKVQHLSAGGANVSAAVKIGHALGNTVPGQLELFKCVAKPRKKDKPPRQLLLFQAATTDGTSADGVLAKIKGKKAKKR